MVHLTQPQAQRLKRLLYMEYTPAELAAEIGANPRAITSAATVEGCPHRRDGRGRVYIVGEAFAAWYAEGKSRHPLGPGQAFCVRCRAARTMLETDQVMVDEFTARRVGTCSACGATVNRYVSRSDDKKTG